jgi:hypothetical protein
MTTFQVRVLEDGTRLYSNGVKYKPVPVEERKYKVRKPDDPRAVRFRGDWFVPIDLLDEDSRVMPSTVPDQGWRTRGNGYKKKKRKR